MFLIFWNFRGSFLSLIFGFWKFPNCISNQNSYFWGVFFIKLFDLRPPYVCFLIFWKFKGSFLSLIFVLKISKLYFESEFPLLGGLFYKTFWFEASLYMFLIFWNFRGSFWVWFLVFENLEIVLWIRIYTFGEFVIMKILIWGLLIYIYFFNFRVSFLV